MSDLNFLENHVQESDNCGQFGWSDTNNTNSFSFDSSNRRLKVTGLKYFTGETTDSNTDSSNSVSFFGKNDHANAKIGNMFVEMFGTREFGSSQPQSGTQEKFEPFMTTDELHGKKINIKVLCYSAMPKYKRNWVYYGGISI